jgi:D-alanyl-D-alanine carboxypeptidase/D-alanyl-D-alanine-endopeptidase (penicillin-binding protein 4)
MRRNSRWRSWHVVIAAAVLLVVAAVVGVAGMRTGGRSEADRRAVKPAPALARADPGVVAVPDSAPKPTPAGVALALAPALADPNLGNLTGRITDAISGDQLWAQGPDVPMQPASTNKVLTSAAALLTLDRNERITTRVMAVDQTTAPGVVVLQGNGDPTLSAAPPGQDTWYPGAARISDLADQVRRSAVKPTSVLVDVSAYSGPSSAPGWDPADIEGGDIAPIEPVMLDGGRTQPVSVESKRSTTPALDAGRALAVALGVNPATVTMLTTAPSDAREIASVQSPPLIERLHDMMNHSDNVMAEAIGREVAGGLHHPESFDGATQAVLGQLSAAKIDTRGAKLVDASGLSVLDRLTAENLDDVVNTAAGPDQPALRPLLDLLPIAGGSGTLSNRFIDDDAKRSAVGWLRAKTGSLSGTNTLAGIVTDLGGRVLTFALLSNNAGPTGRTAIDTVAAALRSCGCGK